MATFGESLRRERELRGITLPELANATKIGLRYLRALENDRFQELPGGVFNRGFVRAAARYMNLDEHHWVGEYARAAQEEPEILARYAPPRAKPPAPSHRGLWSFVLLLALFGAGAYIVHQERQQEPALASPPVAQPPATEATPSLKPARTLSAPERRRAREGATSASPEPAGAFALPDELRLQVDAIEDAWVSVVVDGRTFYTGIMKPGETRMFHASERIEVTTGNASAVILTLNGETLPPLGNQGERRNVTLTAHDLPTSTP